MQNDEILLQFADQLVVALGALASESLGIGRLSVDEPLTFETGAYDRPRTLSLPDVGIARLHGRGCVVEFNSGANVDFDWDQQGRVVFNAWRVRQFANSIGTHEIAEADLNLAMKSNKRFVKTERGWFSLLLLLRAK